MWEYIAIGYVTISLTINFILLHRHRQNKYKSGKFVDVQAYIMGGFMGMYFSTRETNINLFTIMLFIMLTNVLSVFLYLSVAYFVKKKIERSR
ncbi:MAG: hypothetical protein LBT30_01025 [Clostridiales bacterium]|jgi:hypothetical protein|nr:hypothetical protein [Clostridiales bacterium]